MNSTSTTSTTATGMAVDGGNLAKSYNLNVNVNVSAANSLVNNLLAVESACTTPRTPEILNSLIAMTNPLDDYSNYNASERCATGGLRGGSGNDSTSNSSGSPLGSPANGSTPSIQKTCSELIKAGLKLSIESKRKSSGSESLDGIPCTKKLKKEEPYCSDDDDYDDSYMSRCDGLTPEDEERRRRRRERNKIAATKCRLKKRERTVNLVTESEVLETQNIDLKSQIHELEAERRQLAEMLTLHTPSCIKNNPNQTSSPTTPYNPIQPPYDSPTGYPVSATPFEPNSPYIRPESANVLASSYTCDLENPPSNYNQPVDSLDIAPYSVQQPDSYMRQAETPSFVNGEPYPKNGLMLVESPENEYVDTMQFENQDMNGYQYNNHQNSTQQCAHVNNGGARQKFRNPAMDNGCMA